jgi:cobalt-zinc-cadmium efflux system outer membrane protein
VPPKKEEKEEEDKDKPKPKGALERLRVPDELMPGGLVPPIIPKPPKGVKWTAAQMRKLIEASYPSLPPLGDDPEPPPGPEGQPLTLADLQRLALANSPAIKQATADVEAARGAALQAGLPPNPNMAYEIDTFGTTGGGGYIGGFIEQKIIVMGKLQLARAVAAMDLRNAELALRRAQTDLATKVRGGYFAVLVAREGVRVNRALVKFSDDIYNIQLQQLMTGGFAAPYEPMYLRSLAFQARANLIQSRNRYTAAWKQLAAAMGVPGMPLTGVAGRIDVPIPVYDHKQVLDWALAQHTDVRTAENMLLQSRYALQLARLQPVPDPTVHFLLQKDRTGPPFEVAGSLTVSIPVPIWDRNQGGILQAQAKMGRATEESHRVRSDLTSRLADAFERYQNTQVLLGYYRDRILPDLVRVYRAFNERYREEPAAVGGNPPGFGDTVVAQQNLAGAVANYLTTLGQLWQSVVDVADLMQTDDLFQFHGAPVPSLDVPAVPQLCPLPCHHPCSPLPELHQQPPAGDWPHAERTPAKTPASPPAPPPARLPPPKPAPEGTGFTAPQQRDALLTDLPPGGPLLLPPPGK